MKGKQVLELMLIPYKGKLITPEVFCEIARIKGDPIGFYHFHIEPTINLNREYLDN